jgi:hypothetical protein
MPAATFYHILHAQWHRAPMLHANASHFTCCRHEAWEKYQSACLSKAAAAHSNSSSEQPVMSEAGLSRATLGDAIKAGQQQRIMARWEQQQQQWASTEALLAARLGKASPADLAMNRGEQEQRITPPCDAQQRLSHLAMMQRCKLQAWCCAGNPAPAASPSLPCAQPHLDKALPQGCSTNQLPLCPPPPAAEAGGSQRAALRAAVLLLEHEPQGGQREAGACGQRPDQRPVRQQEGPVQERQVRCRGGGGMLSVGSGRCHVLLWGHRSSLAFCSLCPAAVPLLSPCLPALERCGQPCPEPKQAP